MTEPTHTDIANAALRQSIADHFREQFEAARELVESVLGAGWIPVGRHDLVSHDEEERARAAGGPGTPSATVITAEKDGARRHVLLIGDERRECASYQDGFGAMLTEPDPVRGFHDKEGQFHHVHRFALYWGGFDTSYAPRSAQQLADARERREEKAEAKALAAIEKVAEGSLFPDWVRQVGREDLDAKKKGWKR